ncbi:MAG: zinc ribbon domain-containing protein [Halanaerobium sp.]
MSNFVDTCYQQIEYKAGWYGRDLIKIDRFFACSQLCNNCAEKNEEGKLEDILLG